MGPWLALRQANIPFSEETLPVETPALRHGGMAIAGSLAILEYVAELFPDRRLWPEDRARRAKARSVSCEVLAMAARIDVARVLEIGSAAEGPFLFGDFSIADAMLAPALRRLGSYGVASAWCERMLALPAMKEWEERAKEEPSTGGAPRQSYAVIFSSQLASDAARREGYAETAAAMVELARRQPGFLGVEGTRGADGFGITVSYWDSPEAIEAWKSNEAHRAAQARGKSQFYDRYSLRVCCVERAYEKR